MDPTAASRIQSSEARAGGGGMFFVYSTFTKFKVFKRVDSHQEPNQQLLNTRQQDLVKPGHKELSQWWGCPNESSFCETVISHGKFTQ